MARKKPRNRSVKPEKRPRRGLLWSGIAVMALAAGGALLYFFYRGPLPGPFDFAQDRPLPEGEGRKSVVLTVGHGKTGVPVTAEYVGSEACVSCHGKEAADWQKSQHHDAMAEATEQSVLGNFNNAKFNYPGLTSTFFKRAGKFFVNTDGRDGKLADYEIKYTFGVSPLQQYLIEFPDGRRQALSRLPGTRALRRKAAMLVSPLSQRAYHLRRRAALDPSVAKLELHVRGLPLNRRAQKLRSRRG